MRPSTSSGTRSQRHFQIADGNPPVRRTEDLNGGGRHILLHAAQSKNVWLQPIIARAISRACLLKSLDQPNSYA
jgi:hypothetical protein